MSTNSNPEIQDFFAQWAEDSDIKKLCEVLYAHMDDCSGVKLEFVARPGVSYSIRMLGQRPEDVAALLDVIDDDPTDRWISLCFPDAFVTDPEEEGDLVPNGLNGNDARCFSIDVLADATEGYMKARLSEAANAVSGK